MGRNRRKPGRNGTRWAAKLTILRTGREGADRRESVALVSPHRATFRKVVFLSESANPPSPFLKRAKGNFETQRLGTLSGACRDASCTFLFFLPFPLSPHGSSIGWLQPLRLGLHSRQGPGALTHRGTWMDGWDGEGLGRGLGRECWSSVGAVEVVDCSSICWSNNLSRASSCFSHLTPPLLPPGLCVAPDFAPPDFSTPPGDLHLCSMYGID